MLKFRKNILLILLFIIIFSCTVFADESRYVLGTDDVIEIAVWNNPDLTKIITIRDDGYISFPLINEVKAEGLTPIELQNEISQRLEKYIKNPTVTVMVREFKKITVSVIGSVQNQGIFQIKPGTRLLEVLAMAGLNEDAALLEEATLTREESNLQVNVDRLLNQGGHQNYVLNNGDVIYIPYVKREVYILGEVRNPGNYPLDKNTTPADILAMAGGPTDRANLTKVKISHKAEIHEAEIINLEDYLENDNTGSLLYLQDGDIIQIEEVKNINWEKIFTYAAGIKIIHDLIVNW